MKLKIWIVGVMGLLLLFKGTLANSSNEIEKFVWNLDDNWTYSTLSGKTYTYGVSKMDANLIEVASLLKGGRYSTIYRRTYSLDLTKTSSQGYSNPQWPVWDFPLRPGKEWGSTFSVLHPNKPGVVVTFTVKSRVEGWEDVTVPAGNFRSLKIVANFQYLSQNGATDTGRHILWVSSDVAGIVRHHYIEFGTPGSEFGESLVRFKLVPKVVSSPRLVQEIPAPHLLTPTIPAEISPQYKD